MQLIANTSVIDMLTCYSGKHLVQLHGNALNAPTTNFCQMLQEIAEEQRFEVTYVDIQETSNTGKHGKGKCCSGSFKFIICCQSYLSPSFMYLLWTI